MTRHLILDAGPIVAYFDPGDPYHDWAENQFRTSKSSFLTCESVLSEVAFLLSRSRFGLSTLLDFINEAPVEVPFRYAENRIDIRTLIAKYGDVPMSFADACLVRLSELYPDAPILTLDSDFLIYRRNKNEHLPAVLPAERR